MHLDTKFIVDEPAENGTQKAYLKNGLESLENFADRARAVDGLLSDLGEVTGQDASRAVVRLSKELREFEPSVTLLGQVKSGKTTLVNALAGHADLLPSDVNPWTSVVTSLHLIAGKEKPKVGARFCFIGEEEWDRLVQKGGRLGEMANRAEADTELERLRVQVEELRKKANRRLGRKFHLLLGQEHEYGYFDKELLERYVCIGDDFSDEFSPQNADKQGRFADITKSADLYLNAENAPINLCFRDTPGVNDTFMMREQVTINTIRSSRLCVVVLSAHQALTSVDMALIRMISSLKSRDVIIFVNRIDELSDPVNQVPEIEAGIRSVLTEQKGPEDAQIVFGSAQWAHAVLAGTIDNMSGLSASSLLQWAETQSVDDELGRSKAEMVWNLSGLPELHRVLSKRIIEKLGDPLLERVVASAITVASGQRAANKIRISGEDPASSMTAHDLGLKLDAVSERQKMLLLEKVGSLAESYRDRADRVHARFLESATRALIAHLEKPAGAPEWSHNPSELRLLLKSAYSVFASRSRVSARKQYEALVAELAELYFAAFGKAVEGIELQIPEVEEFPAPVAIAQTIALDLKNSWWSSWWRKKRGHKTFANQYSAMVAAETKDFMDQMKVEQPQQVQALLVETLDAFILHNRDIMMEIMTCRGGHSEVEQLCLGADEIERLAQIEGLMDALKGYLGAAKTEAEAHD